MNEGGRVDATIFLTQKCNLRCSYCCVRSPQPQSMPWETALRCLDFLFSFEGRRMRISFFGGEPLLEWDLLQRLSEEADGRAAHRGILLGKSMTTNGSLIDAQRMRWLVAHRIEAAVSVDGDRLMHESSRPAADGSSSFETCLNGLNIALAARPDTDVVMVVDPTNIERLAAGVRYLGDDVGVRRMTISYNVYSEWLARDLALWTQGFNALGDYYVERYRCGQPIHIGFINDKITTGLKGGFDTCDRCNFGETSVAVSPSGRLYPCERLVGDDSGGAMCIGTVFDGFDADNRSRALADRGNDDIECADCPLNPRCTNWCSCINYSTTGFTNHTGGLVCFHERLAIDVADRVANTLFAERNPHFMNTFYDEEFQEGADAASICTDGSRGGKVQRPSSDWHDNRVGAEHQREPDACERRLR